MKVKPLGLARGNVARRSLANPSLYLLSVLLLVVWSCAGVAAGSMYAAKVFRSMDRDSDGVVTMEECVAHLGNTVGTTVAQAKDGKLLSPTTLKQVCTIADHDGDKRLSVEEVTLLLQSVKDEVEAADGSILKNPETMDETLAGQETVTSFNKVETRGGNFLYSKPGGEREITTDQMGEEDPAMKLIYDCVLSAIRALTAHRSLDASWEFAEMESRDKEQLEYDENLFDEARGQTALLPMKRLLFIRVWLDRGDQDRRESMVLDLDILVNYDKRELSAVERAWQVHGDGHREELRVPEPDEDDIFRQLAIFISAGSILMGSLMIYWSLGRLGRC